jgi:ATPase subunit of ABC transporter with duplicated ATPase domains
VALNTWEVHGAKVRPFEGGYAAYILQRLERDRAAQVEQTRRRNLLRKELAWLQRGAPARTSKPKFRLDAAAALIEDVPPPRDSVQLSRLAMTRLGKDVVDLEGVSAGYGNQPVLRDVTWRIGPGDRLGLLGANGAGKTTLLKVVAAELEPSAGRVKRGKTVQVAWLSQSMAELEPLADQRILDLLDSLRASYQAGGRRAGSWTGGGRDSAPGWAAGSEEVTPTALLERLGLGAAQLSTPIRDLSGGQRRRLQLALTLMEEPNLLILDEPSNDLDTDMLTAVEDLLDSWPGTLLVVTHDRYLMERVTDQQFALVGGRLRHLPGGVDQYLGLVAAGAGSATGRAGAANATGTVGSAGTDTAADGGPAAAAKRAREAKKELAAVERRLERLRAAVEQVNQALAGVDPSDWEAVKQHTAELEDLAAQIDVQEERWLELGEQLT